MNKPEFIAAIAVTAGLAMLVGYFWGARDGERIGRDKEWMDSFFRGLDLDKKRRDKLGRFKTKTK
jgi:hypothetical protein